MAKQNFLNKNSAYVESLVSFILDTKPYHSKLTEIIEEFQFSDELKVKIEETTFIRAKVNSAWLYNYFSAGDSSFRSMPLKQLHTPLASHTKNLITVGAAENTDMVSVPFVYSKKSFDGIGVAKVSIERQAGNVEPLLEGHDFFQSHGSFQFQLKTTHNLGGEFDPTWADTRDDNLLSTATARIRELAHDTSNPVSAVNRVRDLLMLVQQRVNALGAGALKTAAQDALTAVLTIVQTPQLPQDYDALLGALVAANATPPAGYTGWLGNNGEPSGSKYVEEELSHLSPSLYFGIYTDTGVRESGLAQYNNISSAWINISNIQSTQVAEAGDSWAITSMDAANPIWAVFSAVSGYIGTFEAGQPFSSSTISFNTTHVAQAPLSTVVQIRNRNKIVFGASSPLETWNLIKVNPIAYSKPVLVSTRYGFIRSLTGIVGEVSLLDDALPTSTIVLTARANGTTFDISSSVEPSYHGVVTVNVPFNDGRLGFTIVQGTSQNFVVNDKFYIDIVNIPAQAIDLDLGYGFDLDSYDHANLLDEFGNSLNFVYDTRFTDYNLAQLNLQVAQTAQSGRKWRIQAIPDLTRPISTIKKDGSGPSNSVDLQDATSGVSPDPASNAAPLYSMAGDANSAPDLRLYHADTFDVQWSDNDFATFNSIGTIATGNHFTSVLHGIDFTLIAGTHPFIGVQSDDGLGQPAVTGGDVFSFTVQNATPILTNKAISVVSNNLPRLIMHGDGFHEAIAADWTVQFTSSTDYSVVGYYTENTPGQPVSNFPVLGSVLTPGVASIEGQSFNFGGLQFTIDAGSSGFVAGDKFTFSTFSRKPSYLVHGSVSGWQKDAVVGEPYWNGLIGFTIDKPIAQVFNATPTLQSETTTTNTWAVGGGTLKLNRLRFDCPSINYVLTPVASGWTISRSDIGSIGWLGLSGSFNDTYISLTTAGISSSSPLTIKIKGDDFDLWNAQDTIVIRRALDRKPNVGDKILVDKRTTDRLAINLNFDQVGDVPDISGLAPITIDSRFIDTFTGGAGLPLSTYSPETSILRNWLPLTLEAKDSSTSVAQFFDAATEYNVRSAGSGEVIGQLKSTGNWPAEFEWAPDFFADYLPLNAEANIVTYGSGFNDKLRANICESIKFLVGGGGLASDALFTDIISVSIVDRPHWNIFQALSDQVGVTVDDTSGGGFLPGFDNELFDEEGFGFDTGIPLIGDFHEAKLLAALPSLSGTQTTRLSDLIGRLGNFLVNGSLANTTFEQFTAAIAADPIGQLLVPAFGIPHRGLGLDITIGAAGSDATKPSTDNTATSFQEAMVFMAIDAGYPYGDFGYDVGGYDTPPERTAIIYSGALPPVPNPTGTFSTYAAYDTPLAVVGLGEADSSDFQARVFEVSFNAAPSILAAMSTPSFKIWLPTLPAPIDVAFVQKIAAGKFRISIPSASEAKLILT